MKTTTLIKMINLKLMNLQLIKIDMKKICFIAISLFCSMVVSAQKFLSAKEMLKMMYREYAAACNAMSKVPGYKKIDLCDGTAFYKNCTADVLVVVYIVAELAAVVLVLALRPVAVVLQIALLAVQFAELLPRA